MHEQCITIHCHINHSLITHHPLHVSHVYAALMTASSEPTPATPYVQGGPAPTYGVPPHMRILVTQQATYAMAKQVPTWLVATTHVLLSLACLCVVATTIATVFMILTLGHALSQVGDRLDDPTPAVSCDPTYFNC